MKLVVVTGTAAHHRLLCASLNRQFDIVGIIHPLGKKVSTFTKFRRTYKQFTKQGLLLGFLDMWARFRERESSERRNPLSLEKGYEEIPREKIHSGCDVRSPEAAEFLEMLNPDATVFLGGPVYPPGFIGRAGMAFNFHSGISPLYNGASTIKFAFANGHPHLCGGTLMKIEPRVDGGAILAHYLPEISAGDSSASLFEKTVAAAPSLFASLLEWLATGRTGFFSIPQPNPLFYFRSSDYGFFQRSMNARHRREDLAARFARQKQIVEYWREGSAHAAGNLYRNTLNRLLWDRKPSSFN